MYHSDLVFDIYSIDWFSRSACAQYLMKNTHRDLAPPRGLFGPPCPPFEVPTGPSLAEPGSDQRQGGEGGGVNATWPHRVSRRYLCPRRAQVRHCVVHTRSPVHHVVIQGVLRSDITPSTHGYSTGNRVSPTPSFIDPQTPRPPSALRGTEKFELQISLEKLRQYIVFF